VEQNYITVEQNYNTVEQNYNSIEIPDSYKELFAAFVEQQPEEIAEFREDSDREPTKDEEKTTVAAIGLIALSAEEKAIAYLKAAKSALDKQQAKLQIEYKASRAQLAIRFRDYRKYQRTKAEKYAEKRYQKKVSESLLGIEAKYNQIISLASHDCLKTIKKICKLVIQKELQTNPDILVSIIESELQNLQFRRIKSIKLHPSKNSIAQRLQIPISFDESLAEDQATIITASGEIQISLSDDLERITHELESMLIKQQEEVSDV